MCIIYSYTTEMYETGLDWSPWCGFARAVEMCNNNGACRNLNAANVMCPSFKVTRDEAHLTRGRANLLRLGLSGQLGPDALHSDAMADAMSLCVGCKGCKRECPVGVDMAAMKIELQYQRTKRSGISLRDRLVAYLPRYAPLAARLGPILNLRDQIPGLAWLSENSFTVCATRIDGASSYLDVDWSGTVAVILGEEAGGLSPCWSGPEVTTVSIPMRGRAGGLNVSTTAAILFFEAARQRAAR